MSTITFRQDSISGGISPTYLGDTKKGQYRIGLGIDPDISFTNKWRMSNCIYPTGYQKFSSSGIDGYPIKFLAPAKSTAYLYSVQNNGDLVRYESTLTSATETVIGTVTGSVANGAAFYNDYIYISTGTDVSRYGPLSGVAALTNTVWTGATLGSQTALTNTTYPTIFGTSIPNHWMHVHTDGQLYLLDFKNNQGMVHVIKTDSSGTNAGSAYNVLDLPFGYYPTSVESYGPNLAITAIQTTDTTLRQGNAALFLWDTISESFYQQIQLPDVFATAMLNNNGRLFVFTGSKSGSRVSLYEGGSDVRQVMFFDDGITPFPGSVGAYGDRVVFGGVTRVPSVAAVVFSFGSKQNEVPFAFHCPVKTSSGSANSPICTAVAYVQQDSGETPRMIAGWGTGSAYGIDKLGYDFNGNQPLFRTDIFEVGKKFKIARIRFNTSTPTAASTKEILTTIYTDNESATAILNGRIGYDAITYKRPELNVSGARGDKNFCIEFAWFGSEEIAIMLPIEIDVEVYDDQPINA